MSGQAISVDHVGIVGADLDSLAALFGWLGFLLTPLARHAGGRTGNRCIMFRDGGYLELVATVAGGSSATLDRFLARYAGIHILALGIDDEAAAFERLRRAGIEAHADTTERSFNDANSTAPRVAFGLLTPPDQPEGRIHLIRHLTPEIMWQSEFLPHPNGAIRLEEVILTSPVPAETAARFSVLAGQPVLPDLTGGYVLPLKSGSIRMLSPEAWPDESTGVSPEGNAPTHPWIGGLTLSLDDNGTAFRQLLVDRSVPHDDVGGVITVQAVGVTMRFRAQPG